MIHNNNNNKRKIFHRNIKNLNNNIAFKQKNVTIGKTKYLPSFSKEWKDTIYSFNKNKLKNTTLNNITINKIIKGYFNLYFKDSKFIGPKQFIKFKKRRILLRKIFVSNAEIQHTNNKANITLFIVNREKKNLEKQYLSINSKINNFIIPYFFLLYKENLIKIYNKLDNYKKEYIFATSVLSSKRYLNYKLDYLDRFVILKSLFLDKTWNFFKIKYSEEYLMRLRKYELLYSLNQLKFNKFFFLTKLNNILKKITEKNLVYNFINLKSIVYNSDIFTDALSIKMKKKKHFNFKRTIAYLLRKVNLPIINTIQERGVVRNALDYFQNKYKDLKLISNVNNNYSFDKLFNDLYTEKNYSNSNKVHTTIFNSINYKNIGGIRVEVKGRLTRRFRADRSVYYGKWKGSLRNIDSSYKGLTNVLYRGNANSNVSYSLAISKRRIGAFAVKGWISGK